MKNVLTLALVLISFISNAQKNKAWAELEKMKTVMKQTFPLMMKNNDLSGAKQNAAELYDKAVALQNGTKPKAFRNAAMTEKFANITAIAKEMNELVMAKASDEDIKNSLVMFHGAFAEIAHHKKAGHSGEHGKH